MKSLYMALKDIQIMLKDRGTVINMFLLPFVFIVVLSTALGGLMEEGEDSRLPLPVVNLDPGSEPAQALIDALDDAGGVQLVPYDQDEAQAHRDLEDREIERLLTIPAGFSAAVANDSPVTLELLSHPDADDTTNGTVLQVVNGVAREMALQTQLIASFQQMGDMQGTSSAGFQVFTEERVVAQAQGQFERAKTDPLVTVEQTQPESLSERDREPNSVEQYVPGLTIVFVFLTAGGTALSIYQEKKLGSFRRLMAAPLSKASMLVGKTLPNFVMGMIQIVVIFAVSMFLLPLLGLDRLTLGEDPLALVVVSVLVALCSTGLGVVIAALARTEAQIGGVTVLVLWTMGAVGGCLFPQFLLRGVLDVVGKVVPHYWALRAYQDLIVRGRVLADVTTEILVLSGFTLVFFAFGLWRFDFD